MQLKIEFHSHTDYDPQDSIHYSAYQLIEEAARQSFDALAITCHDALQWSRSLSDYAASAGILLIPGVEATIEDKHVLIYGLERYRRPVTFNELRELRRSHPEIFTIAAHPFFPGSTCLGHQLTQHPDCFDAVEYCHFYTRSLNFNHQAVQIAREQKKPLVGTSDVHLLTQLGRTYSLVTLRDKSFEAISSAIKAGDVKLVSTPLSWPEIGNLLFQIQRIYWHGKMVRHGFLSRKPTKSTSSPEE